MVQETRETKQKNNKIKLQKMLKIFKKMSEKKTEITLGWEYLFFRIVVGLSFAQHGAQKLFGALGGVGPNGGAVETFSLFWFAGVIELFGGLLIALGLFTRVAALLAVFSMGYAYLFVHLPNGFFSIMNKGELALLYFVSMLLILKFGRGKCYLENFFEKTK
jgi:putative oxidoreductase